MPGPLPSFLNVFKASLLMKQLHKEKKDVYLVLPTGGQMPEGEGFCWPSAIQGYKSTDEGIF